MSKDRITIKSIAPRKIRIGKSYLHYRLEKRPGALKKGVVLPAKGSTYLSVSDDLGLERRGDLYFPNFFPPRDQLLLKHGVVVRKGASCTSEFVKFGRSFFRGLKLVETRVGYFNEDSDIDVAYIVRDSKGKLFSYVLFKQHIANCFDKNRKVDRDFRDMWRDVASTMVYGYLCLYGKVSSATMKKFVDLTRFQAKLFKANQNLGFQTIQHLGKILKKWRKFTASKADIALIVDKLLPSIIKGRWQTTHFFYRLTSAKGYKQKLAIPLIGALEKMDRKLTVDQFTLLSFALKHGKGIKHPNRTIREIVRISGTHSGKELFKRLYKLFNGFKGVSSSILMKYQKMLKFIPDLQARDILAAERTIGARAALKVWKSFRMHRFDRYHPSILKHLVKMANNPKHDQHKPLVIAVTATNDHSDMFYWGRSFKYDPRIRLVVVETPNSYQVYKRVMWDLRKKYGIPDTVLFTAHGVKKAMLVGGISLKNNWMIKRDFKGYFGDKEGLVVLNTCEAGARPEKGKLNIAQMIANAMGAETLAVRSLDLLLSIKVYIDKEGRARLRPVFFEAGWPHFGFNFGGSRFYPNKTDMVPESVYNSAADINTGWKPGAGISIVGRDPVLSLMFGGRYAFAHRVRLGLDIAMHYNPLRQSISYTLDPEAFVGLTNHLGFFGGGRFGVTTRMDGQVTPLYQANFGAKIMLPFMNGELDIGGASVNGEKPKFFFSFQGRF